MVHNHTACLHTLLWVCANIRICGHTCTHTHIGWTKLSTSMTDMESIRVKCWLSYRGMSERKREREKGGEDSNVVLCAAVLDKNQTLFHCIFWSLDSDHIGQKIVCYKNFALKHLLQVWTTTSNHVLHILNVLPCLKACSWLNFHWGQDSDMLYRCINILCQECVKMGI